MEYSIPYGHGKVKFDVCEDKVIFNGETNKIAAVADLELAVIDSLESPVGSEPLRDLAKGKKNIVILIEDITRSTPLKDILPIVVNYLNRNGIPDSAISFLTAPGTHRLMTEEEILEKVGSEIVKRFKIRQHDANRTEDLMNMGQIAVSGYNIPVQVNRYAVKADLLIGIGNIVPHSDAGYSGGAKILQPGVCGFATTSATHAAAAFCPDIPLGLTEGNPCREGMEAVAKIAHLAFIINVVKNGEDEIIGVFGGDFIKAHRKGVLLAQKSYTISIPELADIVVVSSYPGDIDFWQGTKGITGAYFAVKKGGVIVYAAPCYEGLAHNHPKFREWLSLSLDEVLVHLKESSPYDKDADMVSAVLSVCNNRIRDRARVFIVTEGLSDKDLEAVQYMRFDNIQSALDEAIRRIPNAKIGILPMGGITFPMLTK